MEKEWYLYFARYLPRLDLQELRCLSPDNKLATLYRGSSQMDKQRWAS
jgi:hypothetical protein